MFLGEYLLPSHRVVYIYMHALMMASWIGHKECVKLLLNKGAEINLRVR